MQGQGQGHGAFELPTTSEVVHAGGDDRSPLAGLSGWATVCKTVCPMLSDRCPACPILSVCDVGGLSPNGWMDQDETLYADRPRPWRHYVRWGPSYPSRKGHSRQFSAHICCGQMAAWIDITWYGGRPGPMGTPLLLPKKGAQPPIFAPCLLCQTATWIKMVLGTEVGLIPGDLVLDGDPAPR